MNKNILKKYIGYSFSLFLAFAASILLYFFLDRFDNVVHTLKHIFSVLAPFIIGAIIAYIVRPFCVSTEKHFYILFHKIKSEKRRKRTAECVSVFIGIFIFVLFVYFTCTIIIPQTVSSIGKLISLIPSGTNNIINWINNMLEGHEKLSQYSQQIIDKVYNSIRDWMNNTLMNSFDNVASGISSSVIGFLTGVFNLLIGIVVAIYILLEHNKLSRQAHLIIYSLFNKKHGDAIVKEIKYANKVFSGFINGKLFDSLIVGIFCYIGMIIFRFATGQTSYMSEILVALIVALFNLIPFFGWYIGLFLSALLILVINPIQCIFFIIFDFILMQADGNILGPKIIGNNTGLSSLWVLFALFVFGDLWGFMGMLIGVPLFAVLYHIFKQLIFKGLRKRNMNELADAYNNDYPENNN